MKVTHTHLGAALAAIALGTATLPALAAPDSPQALRELRQQEKQRVDIYKAFFPDVATGRKAAITFEANVLEAAYNRGYLVLELNDAEIAKLQRFGFRIEHAPEYIAKRDDFLNAIQSANAARQRANPSATDIGIQAIPGYACYETVEETFAAAQGFTTSHPQLASWIDIGDSWEKTRGVGGHDLRVLKLTNNAVGGTNKPKLFINSAIHAREYTTAPLVLDFARWLVNGHGNNADATWILDHHEVHMLLHTNPDGRKKAETGLSWRKNTNTAYCGNSNNRGADLNRNFGFNWNSTGGEGSSGNQCDLTYRGPSRASEPEVQAVENYIRRLWPDRRGPNRTDAAPTDTSGIHLDIHSYSELVLWPWGDVSTPAPNGTALQTLGRRFAYYNNYSPMPSIGLYPTDGTSDGPSYGELGVAAFTFELGTSFFQSCGDYTNTIKPDNLPALIYAAKVVRTPYLTPAGPDVTSLSLSHDASGAGVPAGTRVTLTASVTDTRFNNSNGAEPVQNISGAEAYVDVPPWQTGAQPIALNAGDGAYNATTEGVTGTLDTSSLATGKHIVYVRGRDASGQWGPVTAAFLKVGTTGTPTLNASFTHSCTALACSFDAGGSTGDITSYAWNFGDASSGSGVTARHSYAAGGSYNVSLTVSDGQTSSSTTRTVSVTAAPSITLSLSATPRSSSSSWVNLAWSGASGTWVDVYRDGRLLGYTRNDGAYREARASGTWRYRVCQRGSTSACSPEASISF
ncbi:M14 family zinc carboxypeptidase [Caldimonas brevitalea]|uniref:Carboxypeptidase n=1 Tax=Caldimonas brevitalea TaxID=413882 RepID=A0A0G3BSW3_9BURK|nr:M14 family zinc carboxypeptidase [Caldimonas brevitalea]AKJ29625.1 carboxypeptidase [Caldimonas brevitalea]